MIILPSELNDNTLVETDICIIGSGAAGISIALEMLGLNKKVAILAGGTEIETVGNQDLYKGIIAREGFHEPLEENRRRAFGGTTTAWGGRCIPFDSIDFKKREWIPFSGWPYSYQDIEKYLAKATVICKAGAFNFDAVKEFPSAGKEIIPSMDNENIISSKLERWSTPVNFAKDYLKDLTESLDIQVFIDTHLTTINTDDRKDTVSSILAVTKNKQITIKATQYILACGGIENPRLLLASKNKSHPNGIGNDNDLVGRFYMGHLLGIFSELSPKNRKSILFDFEKDKEGVYCRRRWWVTEKAQFEKKIGNVIFFLHKNTNQDGHRDALFSFVFVAKYGLSLIKAGSIMKVKQLWIHNKKYLKEHLLIISKDGWKQIPVVLSLAKQRFQERRLPFILPSVHSKTLGLYFQAEQVPNRESRITLSETDFDVLKIPRAVVDVKFSNIDKETIIEGHKIFVETYLNSKIGDINFDLDKLNSFIEERIKNFNSAAHHLGTTRISIDPTEGVVDADCKVHGINNLFIAGSSVFPTGGHANPTLMIVALALKLADHIKSTSPNKD